MSIADKLLYLDETKTALRDAINLRGGDIATSDTFRSYVNQLQQLIWMPDALFANGEQGAWYDPSDISTLFQDAYGTTPVTTDGDPAGLVLDKSQGAKPGPEQQPNGDFANGLTGWLNAEDYWQPEAGAAYHPPGSAFRTLRSVDISSLRGKTVKVSFEVTATLGLLRCQYRTAVDAPSQGGAPTGYPLGNSSGLGSGIYSSIHRVPDDASFLSFARHGVGEVTELWIRNVSIRELPGNHASQAVSANRPVYRTDGTLHWLQFDGVDDAMNVTLPSIAAATVATAAPTGTVIQYPVDLSTGSYTISESHSGIIIREGELTVTEQQRVTDYLDQLAGVTL